MPLNQEIYSFGVKWLDLFCNLKITSREMEDPSFADECVDLGFQMDYGIAFEKAYPGGEALNDHKELDKIIESITDISLLGSAIFPQWSYFTHWARPDEDIFSCENRLWFITAFGRLESLASESGASASIFTSSAQKLRVVSNNICCGHCPQLTNEVEQHLLITADGRGAFSSYFYGNGDKCTRSRSQNFKIDASQAASILNMVGNYFSGEHDASFTTDVGTCKMMLTNEENIVYHFRGSPHSGCSDGPDNISNAIRGTLDIPELPVFDGRSNSDRIERISVDYRRATKIKFGGLSEGAIGEYATWDYSEQLTIDRKTETLEHTQKIGSGCQVSRKYHVEEGIASLLDSLDAETFFFHTEGVSSDAVRNPLEKKNYRITIDYLYGDQRVMTGFFDKNGLPDDFSDFAETVFDFMWFYGMGEILNPTVYGKVIRKKNDRIFCNVRFDKYGKTYCYLTDDDTLEAEDYVIVPVGKDDHESVAKIESIEYHPVEEAPFPIDKIKKIIRKADRTEDGNGLS